MIRSAWKLLVPKKIRSHQFVRKIVRKYRNLKFRWRYENKDKFICKVKHCDIKFCTKDEYSKRWFYPRYDQKIHEPAVTLLFAELSKKSEYILDVGANIGWYTCVAGCVSDAYIFSVEMDKNNLYRLKKNVKINKIEEKVDVLDLAISDKKKTMSYKNKKGEANSGYRISAGGVGSKKVKCDTIDSLFGEKIDLIKVDVEGHEMNVLMGGRMSIESQKPDIVVEVHPVLLRKYGFESKDLISFAKSMGYEPFRVVDPRQAGGSVSYEEISSDPFQNIHKFYLSNEPSQGNYTIYLPSPRKNLFDKS